MPLFAFLEIRKPASCNCLQLKALQQPYKRVLHQAAIAMERKKERKKERKNMMQSLQTRFRLHTGGFIEVLNSCLPSEQANCQPMPDPLFYY